MFDKRWKFKWIFHSMKCVSAFGNRTHPSIHSHTISQSIKMHGVQLLRKKQTKTNRMLSNMRFNSAMLFFMNMQFVFPFGFFQICAFNIWFLYEKKATFFPLFKIDVIFFIFCFWIRIDGFSIVISVLFAFFSFWIDSIDMQNAHWQLIYRTFFKIKNDATIF